MQTQSPWQTLLILWGALFASTVVYLGVLQVIDVTEMEPVPLLPYALGGASLVIAIVSIVLPKRLFETSMRAKELAIEEVPDPNASVMFRDQTPMIRVFAEPDAAEKTIATSYFTPFILGMALSEAVAIFGFLLGVQRFELPVILPFFVAAWILMAIRFPLRSRILRRGAALCDASFESK